MTKYRRLERAREERPWKVHPIWRGIGCLWLILIPVISFAASYIFVRGNLENNWIRLPTELYRYVDTPAVRIPYRSVSFDFDQGLTRLFGERLYNADVALTIIFSIIGLGFMSIPYSFFYKMWGPPRYGPFDSEPIRAPKKRRY